MSIIVIILAFVFILGFGIPNFVKSLTELEPEHQKSSIKVLYGFIQIAIAGYFGIAEFKRIQKVK